jgi:hypothetical protein
MAGQFRLMAGQFRLMVGQFRLMAGQFRLMSVRSQGRYASFGRTNPYSRIFRYSVFDEIPSTVAALP